MVRGERGFALVLTLLVTALMVAVATELIHQVYVDTTMSRAFRDGQQASLMAESGVTGGVKLLQKQLSGQEYSTLSPTLKQEDETGTLEITATEESGKINLNDLVTPRGELNAATLNQLKLLGKRLKIPDELWEALADWLDNDDLPRSNGAESSYYQSQKPSYTPRNAKMVTLAELSLVKGFTPEMVTRLSPFVTVYPGRFGVPPSMININTAPMEVIAALTPRMDDSTAARIVEERRRLPFKTLGELSRIPGGAAISQEIASSATCKGTVFRITSLARVKDSVRVVEAVVILSGGEILSWQEY
jgi:general secretion pathway protein K